MNLREALTFILERVDERTGMRSDVTFCDMTEGVHHDDCKWCAITKFVASGEKDENERKAEVYDLLIRHIPQQRI